MTGLTRNMRKDQGKLMHRGSLLLAALLAGHATWSNAESATSRSLSNAPFASQAHGLVGALAVDGAPTRAPTDQYALTSAALSRAARSMDPRLSQLVRQLRRQPRLSRRARFFVDRRSVSVDRGRLVLPELVSTSRGRIGGGRLTVNPSGWSTQDTARIQNFVGEAMPVIEQVYGKPAFAVTVTLLKDSALSDSTDPHKWIIGSYNASTSTIHMPPFGSGGADRFDADPEAEWNLVHMLLHAFHDDAQFSFDAWEEGFARAASIVVMAQLRTNFVNTVLRISPNWKGPNYEQQNYPELACATFFNGFEWMAAQRLWASPMAWLKAYAESPTFFRDFNESYYAALDPAAAVPLSGNVPALKQLAASRVPTVEGLPFAAWFNQQHVLNSSVFTGRKLYAAAFPSVSSLPNTTDIGYGPNIWLQYFETGQTGAETPLSGKVQFTYRNDRSDDLFAEEGNEATIVDGIALHSPLFFNVGGPNRIELDTYTGAFFRTLPYPHEVIGTVSGGDPVFNDLCGTVAGSDEGTLAITVSGRKAATSVPANVTRGVFWVPADTFDLSGPLRLSFTYTPTGGGPTVTFQRNVAYDYYVLGFQAPGATTKLTHTFTYGTTGFQLMSVPLRPVADDEATALGVDPGKLLLAQYQPRRVAGAGDPDRYELYPNLSSRIGPGQGYFLRVLQNTPVKVEGTPVSTSFEIPLPAGFSLIGQPFNHQTALSSLKVRLGNGDPVSLSAAQGSGLIGQGLWKFNQGSGYQLETNQLDPWNAYWIRITNPEGATLVVPPTAKSRAAALPAGANRGPLGDPLPAGSWCFRLAARTEGAQDSDNFIGVAPGAAETLDQQRDIVQPPELGGYVSLYFPHAGAGGDVTKLAADFRAPFSGTKTWDMVVETDLPERDIHLVWDDLSSLPGNLQPLLVDVDGGVSRYMRTSSGYTFRTGATRSPRRFQVVLNGSSSGHLVLGAITPVRGPRGYLVSYSVSAPAEVSAQIVNTGGRLVRHMFASRAAQPGLNSLFWDLRDEQGRAVPRGFYLLQMMARDDQGRVVRATRSVQVMQ